MSAGARRYQAQIAGAPEGWAYSIRRGPGPKDKVDFDGFKEGVLLEAKGPGYRELFKRMAPKDWFEGAQEMINQARRQFQVAQGRPIQWHFAEREVADHVRILFQSKGLAKVQVVHTPPQP